MFPAIMAAREFLTSTLGRYVALGGIILVLMVGAYWTIRNEAVATYELHQRNFELEKLKDAIKAEVDALDGVSSPDGLLANDGHKRD